MGPQKVIFRMRRYLHHHEMTHPLFSIREMRICKKYLEKYVQGFLFKENLIDEDEIFHTLF